MSADFPILTKPRTLRIFRKTEDAYNRTGCDRPPGSEPDQGLADRRVEVEFSKRVKSRCFVPMACHYGDLQRVTDILDLEAKLDQISQVTWQMIK